MATPTLPAGYQLDQAGGTPPLPSGYQLDSKAAQPSAASRLGSSALSGAGVVSQEQGKNFFVHPLDALKAMATQQGDLGERAGKELANKDYVRGLTHGVEWLMPGLGPVLAHAGDQLESGDTAGGIGTTLGAAANIVATHQTPAIADAASAKMATMIEAAKQATPKQAAAAVGGVAGAYGGSHIPGFGGSPGPVGAILGAERGAALSERLLGKERANAPIFGAKPTPPAEIAAPELDATGENKPFAGGMDEAAPAAAQPTPAAAPPPAATPKTSPAAVQQQLETSLGVDPVNIKPGVSMRNQAAAQGLKLPEGFTPVDSSVLKAYKYDPATQEFDAITNSGQRFRHAEVTPDQFKAFEEADSKGKAWNDLRNGAGVTPLGKVNENGVLQPRIKPRSVVTDPETGKPEFSDVLEAKQSGGQATTTPAPKAKAAAAAAGSSSEDDLTSLLQQSLDQVKAEKGGVRTTAAPADLAKRWGVDESSIEDTDRNVRGLNAEQSQAYINKLSDSYQQGRPVEPVIETRDENNNITSVDGRHRALAAKKAGIERIPVIVRRISVQ